MQSTFCITIGTTVFQSAAAFTFISTSLIKLMKPVLLSGLFIFLTLASYSQNKKKLQKSWIKTETVNLSNKVVGADTLYARYTFDRSALNISFYPGWNDFKQDWSINENNLTIGLNTYDLEELT